MQESEIQTICHAVLERIFVPLEASARHVHLTRAQCLTLFGTPLTPARPLSQPGQYLSQQRVTIIGPKGRLENVAVLGPARKEAQVEISLTDGRLLGVAPPIRESGDVKNTPGITLLGPQGRLVLPYGVIAAQRHVHLTPESAAHFGVKDKQLVTLQVYTDRPVLFQDVLVRVRADFAPAVHLDFDEANACGLKPGDLGRLLP